MENIAEFVGTSPKMLKVFNLLEKVAPTNLPVLILGESGTGKELTAQAIHEKCFNKTKPFVAINCAAIPVPLFEAEVFGHEKGAFTGAYNAKQGKFEQADGGTLFLDEIGEFPKPLQSKLLRFLENRVIERVGSIKSKRVDVRIITATNKELEQAVFDGEFRQDLFHRINVFTICLPPLRERGEDKINLAKYFLEKIGAEHKWKGKGFTPSALEAIQAHPWSGNVRELVNRIRRAVVVQDDWIEPEDLELHTRQPVNNNSKALKDTTQQARKDLILKALREDQYNISQTARSLGISRSYLYSLMKKLDVHYAR